MYTIFSFLTTHPAARAVCPLAPKTPPRLLGERSGASFYHSNRSAESLSPDVESFSPSVATLSTGGATLSTDGETFATGGATFATDGATFATDGETFATDRAVLATDRAVLATGGESLATDEKMERRGYKRYADVLSRLDVNNLSSQQQGA